MDFQHRAGGKTGVGGVASASESNRDRRERLRQLALETIDLNKVSLRNKRSEFDVLCDSNSMNEFSFVHWDTQRWAVWRSKSFNKHKYHWHCVWHCYILFNNLRTIEYLPYNHHSNFCLYWKVTPMERKLSKLNIHLWNVF